MDIKKVFAQAKSKSDVCRSLGFSPNGTGIRKVTTLIDENNIDISHFDGGSSKKVKWKTVTKTCPVCNKQFKTKEGHSREKTTCGHSCSNVHFRSGKDNGNWQDGGRTRTHRIICFKHWPHTCAIPNCGWDISLDVHHIDGDNKNNHYRNLIPLCRNHHMLTILLSHKQDIQLIINGLIKKKFGVESR